MAHEQMPPVFAWSYKYVAAALPPQQGACDTLLGANGRMPRLAALAVPTDSGSTSCGSRSVDPSRPMLPILGRGRCWS